jgi:aspartyl-tRNA(Asn)/glutamyl-tRNA(Gln) amidotransferase subunit B
MRQLRQILRYLEVCDGNMEEGSLRCDANVSVRRRGAKEFGTKVEIKNINSFRFVERAIGYEIERQKSLALEGEKIVQETRLYDETTNSTRSMRTKEFAEDYRYFPDPDLPPLIVERDWVSRMEASLPELPQKTFHRFRSYYKLDDYLCELLTEEKLVAHYFDQALAVHNNPVAIANWITSELFGRLNKESLDITQCPVSPENLGLLVSLIDEGVISGKIAKTVFDEMFVSGASPDGIVAEKGLRQITDTKEIETAVEKVLAESPVQLRDYLDGKTKMFGYFVGQVMKITAGMANPKLVNELLEKKLKEKAAPDA